MKKIFLKFYVFCLYFAVLMSNAQIDEGVDFENHQITGSNIVNIGDLRTYELISSNTITESNWTITKGKVINKISNSKVLVKWTEGGIGNIYVSFKENNSVYYDTLTSTMPNIIINEIDPEPPIILSLDCNGAILESSGIIPFGFQWYWQGTNPNGQDESYPATDNFEASESGYYYIRAKNLMSGTWSTNSSLVEVILEDLPKPTNGLNKIGCEGNTLIATATAPLNAYLYWFDAPEGGNRVLSPIINSPGSITYYAESRSGSSESSEPICKSNSRTAVTLTINNAPDDPIKTGDITEIATSPIQILNATNALVDNTNIVWYRSNGTETNSPTLNEIGSVTYYAEKIDPSTGCRSISRTAVTLTIQGVVDPCATPPLPPDADNSEIIGCEGDTLKAIATANNANIVWFDSPQGGNPIDNPIFNNVGEKIYYAESQSGGGENNEAICKSNSRTAVTLIIKEAPTFLNNSAVNIIEEATSPIQTLNANSVFQDSSNITWYLETGDEVVGLPILNTVGSITFYAEKKDPITNCKSLSRKAVTLSLTEIITDPPNPTPTPPKPVEVSADCDSLNLKWPDNQSPPENVLWYWQTSSIGKDTTNSTSTFSSSSNLGLFYLRAKDTVTGLWSDISEYEYVWAISGRTLYYLDADNDGYYSDVISSCSNPGSSYKTTGLLGSGDCDDNNPAVYPGAEEICGNEIDNNCDGEIPECANVEGTDRNYIYTITPQHPSLSIDNFKKDSVIRSITYFDGLGRKQQQIAIGQGGNHEDIITHFEYDDFGRQEKEYLPYAQYVDVGGTKSFRKLAKPRTESFYAADKYQNTPNPFSQKKFENSPLSRVLKQAAPGLDWAQGRGHEIEFEYQTNTSADQVRMFNVLLNEFYEPTLTDYNGSPTFYSSGELIKTITKDENWKPSDGKNHTTEEFKNKQGQVILKRTFADIEVNEQIVKEVPHNTYYIYDDFGNLTYVLPPKINTNNTSLSAISIRGVLNDLGYQYKYDSRNRLIEKTIPGKEKEFIIYDNLDRPVLTQDAELRKKKKWLFTKYDAHSRVTYTGIYISDLDPVSMQETVKQKTTPQKEFVTGETFDATLQNSLGVDIFQNTISKTDPNTSWNNAYFTTQESITGDGSLQFTTNNANFTRIGLNDSNSNASYSNINYSFYVSWENTSTPLEIYENGSRKYPNDDTFQEGDVLKIERIGTTVHYKKNDQIIYTSQTPSTGILYGNGFLFAKSYMYNLYNLTITSNEAVEITTLPKNTLFEEKKQMVNEINGTDIFYSNSAFPSVELSSSSTAANNVPIKLNEQHSTANYNEIISTTSDNDYFTFNQSMVADGAIKFPVDYGNFINIGLDATNNNTDRNNIDYMLQFYYVNYPVKVFEKNVLKFTGSTYNEGDVFTIKRIGSNIQYLKNDVIFYTSTNVPDVELHGTGVIYFDDKSIENVMIDQTGNDLYTPVTLNEFSNATIKKQVSGVLNDTYFNSTQVIEADGSFEFTPLDRQYIRVGFNSSYANTIESNIDYSMKVSSETSSTPIRIYENGDRKYPTDATYVEGDILKIERIGTTVHYKKNNQVIYTSLTPSTGKLYVNGFLSYDDYPISNFTISGVEDTSVSSQGLEVLTVNYYDTYNDSESMPESHYNQTFTNNTKGLVTESKVKVLDQDNKWITTKTYYDHKARPIYVITHNEYLGTTDIVESELDFVGKVKNSITKHSKVSQPNNVITTEDFYKYDHTGRLLTQSQKINNQDSELIVSNTYDELGMLVSKKVGGSAESLSEDSSGLQTIDYKYNIRGWLTHINNDTFDNDNDLFNFILKYNDIADVNKKLFNGNISQTIWNTASNNDTDNTVSNNYVYTYDALNRITGAKDNTGNYNLGGYDSSGNLINPVTYDKNGNIMSLSRNGHTQIDANQNVSEFGIMDNLTYTYASNSNKLTKVNESNFAAKSFGFKKSSEINEEDDYTYDANGNMISDKNKGIENIVYNHLNLPTKVVFTGEDKYIDYIYDATGTKLAKLVTDKSSLIKTKYAGNYIYKKDSVGENLQFFNHPEGYVKVDNSGNFDYVYQYKDHLGNVRLSYADSNNDGEITASTEIIEESNYYPFGLEHKGYNNVVSSNSNSVASKFKYNGVELEEALGLNLYEMKYRHYDPAIGRWLLIDPRVENLYALTPYNAFLNDPIRYSDPDGDIPPQLIAGLIGAAWEYGSQVYDNYQSGNTGYDAWVGNVDFADVATEGVATGLTLGLNKVPGANIGVTAVTELVKSSIDIKGNGDVDVIGVSENKQVGDVLVEATQNTATAVVAGKVADKLLGGVKNQVAKTVKNAIEDKGNAYKNLNKANNIRANGNASQAARGSNAGTSNSRFKDVVKADGNLQTANAASTVVNSQAADKAVGEASSRATKSTWETTKSTARSWWNSVWD